jgi:hypothetical protein
VSPLGVLAEIRRRDPALSAAGWVLVAGFLGAALAAPFDSREILGINPWIKPMKFTSSVAVFLWTLAWFMAEAEPRRARRVAVIRWTILVSMIVEVALITLQSARGTTSHFNVRTAFDLAVFNVMGAFIVLSTLATAAFIGTLRGEIPSERAGYLRGIRLGLAVFVLASLQGFMMVANMAHSVPRPDGGPGLPFVNWSMTTGDLRVAHFVGLHALQALPIAGYLLDRAGIGSRPARTRWVTALAAAWLAVMGTALILALRGRPLVGI